MLRRFGRCCAHAGEHVFDQGGGFLRLLHGEQVAAVEHHHAALGDLRGHGGAHLLHFQRGAATDEAHLAFQGMAAQRAGASTSG